MLTLKEVKENDQIIGFIKETKKALEALSYTDHGMDHVNLVTDRAISIAKGIGLKERDIELAGISAFCHDMGNFLSRSHHNYFGAILFHQVFGGNHSPEEVMAVMHAISNHDRGDITFLNKISAVTVLADKSDVRRSRVATKDMKKIKGDIHNRVNYAVRKSQIKVDKKRNRICLILDIDTKVVPVIEYFEIFTNRMIYCRKAAEYLNYDFGLVINNFELL